jgi:thiol:disulfide interchange protein DsbC
MGGGKPCAPAAAPDMAKVREALKLRLPKTPIDAINCKGLGGLCEVVSKSTLFYVDRVREISGDRPGLRHGSPSGSDGCAAARPQSRPARRGGRSAAQQSRDARRRSPNPSSFSEHPRPCVARQPSRQRRDHLGACNGPKVVVFSDFHCGYCKKLEAELKAIGARVEERPISIFGAESRRDAERVLCSPRPELALHMAYSGLALANPKPCDTSGLDANEAFARAHGFGGTPVIVRPADGAVLEGFRPAAVLREFLRPLHPGPHPSSQRIVPCGFRHVSLPAPAWPACQWLRHVRHQCRGRFHLPRAEGRLRTGPRHRCQGDEHSVSGHDASCGQPPVGRGGCRHHPHGGADPAGRLPRPCR